MLGPKKRKYYDKLNINSVTNNKLFWKTICPLFSDKKFSKSSKITLLGKDQFVTDDTKILETFDTFLQQTLNIEKNTKY